MSNHFLSFLLICLAGTFSECTNNKAPKTDTFGELDKTAIAVDTAMEVNMDLSYEYQKTLIESDSVVYDFLAYDRPMKNGKWESKFHVIRRTGSQQDTIIKDHRAYAVRSVWLSDLNENGRPEIMFYERAAHEADQDSAFRFYAYETDGRQHAHKIKFDFKSNDSHYAGGDTFFVYQNYLIRKFRYSDIADSRHQEYMLQSYKLSNGRVSLDKEKLLQ